MKQNRSLIITAIIFMLAVANFFRIKGNDEIRLIQFMSIFVIGLLAGILIKGIAEKIRNNK
jgi:Ca2+/H+ antiporter